MKKFICFIIIIILTFSLCGFTQVTETNENETELLIMMYHSILSSKKDRYIVTPTQFENDIKMYIEMGYTPILPKELKHFVDGTISLPKKTIMITFDDGEYNFMYYALDIIKKYNYKANMNIVGRFSNYSSTNGEPNNPNYSYLTWEQIKYLSDLEYIEIGNHTYDMHNFKPRFGINRLYNENDEMYKKALRSDVIKMQAKLLSESNCSPISFAFPFGKYNDIAIDELQKIGFSVFLTCNEGVNRIKVGDDKKLLRLKRINREGSYSETELKQVITKYSNKAKKIS